MATIYIDHLKPGMVLNGDLKDLNGLPPIGAGTELTDRHLRIMRESASPIFPGYSTHISAQHRAQVGSGSRQSTRSSRDTAVM